MLRSSVNLTNWRPKWTSTSETSSKWSDGIAGLRAEVPRYPFWNRDDRRHHQFLSRSKLRIVKRRNPVDALLDVLEESLDQYEQEILELEAWFEHARAAVPQFLLMNPEVQHEEEDWESD
ncbi:hypothetical protein BGX23_005900 [Mortierella sp. AD031]|nr:hypothetical protein BGX23_005900 [Mortierella sp. AD031]